MDESVGHVRTRDGVRIAVRELGRGEPLLLLHGFMGASGVWGNELLRRLASRYRICAVDLPGHGASDKPTDPDRYALPEVVQDLLEVLDARRVGRAAWVGYSMGGRVALGAAVLHPDRVGGLVIESGSPGLADPAERAARRRADEERAGRLEREGLNAFLTDWETHPLFAGRILSRAAVRRLAAVQRNGDARALAACLRGLGTGAQPAFWNDLVRIEAPALLMAGAEDGKFRAIADRMADAMPRARVVIVEGAGHRVHLEQPDRWLEAVRDGPVR